MTTVQLINDDCLNALSTITDNSVDLLLTDPPYNISRELNVLNWEKNTVHSQKFDDSFDKNWDSISNDKFVLEMKKWATAWYPKIRNGGSFAIFISDRYLSHLWDALEEAGFEPKRVWTWKKPAAVPFNRNINPVSGAEYLLFGIKPKGKRTFNSNAIKGSIIERFSLADKVSNIVYRYVKDGVDLDQAFKKALIDAKKVEANLKKTENIVHAVVPNTITYSGGSTKNRIHPTQKPQEILDYFIALLSNPGDIVLDSFAGSGSTGISCIHNQRHAILIEQDKKMFDAMSKAIKEKQHKYSFFK